MVAVPQTTLINQRFWINWLYLDIIGKRPALERMTAWCRTGVRPLSKRIMFMFLAHICVTLPQWDKLPIATATDHAMDALHSADTHVYATLYLLLAYRKHRLIHSVISIHDALKYDIVLHVRISMFGWAVWHNSRSHSTYKGIPMSGHSINSWASSGHYRVWNLIY